MAFILPSEYQIAASLFSASSIREFFLPDLYKSLGFPTEYEDRRSLFWQASEGSLEDSATLMEELGEISFDDWSLINLLRTNYLDFQRTFFDQAEVFDTKRAYLGYFLQYAKISELLEGARNIFEIGPGQGHLAVLTAKSLEGLESYSALDAVQSNYCFQSAYWSNAIGINFVESALRYLPTAPVPSYLKSSSHPRIRPMANASLPLVRHLPWWWLDLSNSEQYRSTFHNTDLIIASACLNELKPECLNFLLDTLAANVQIGTRLFYQCPGHRYDSRNLVETLFSRGFHPEFIVGWNPPFVNFRLARPMALFKATGVPLSDVSYHQSLALSNGTLTFVKPEWQSRLVEFYARRHSELTG